jgi:predicted outer membrane repeat protein
MASRALLIRASVVVAVVVAVVLATLTSAASPAWADDATVTNCVYGDTTTPGTFAYAVEQAQNGSGGTVSFTCSGTIIFPAGDTITISDGPVTIDGSGRNVILSGDDAAQLFIVDDGQSLTLDSLTITGGNADAGGSGTGEGGAVDNGYDGTLDVRNVAFTNNSAENGCGGAICSGDLTTSSGN